MGILEHVELVYNIKLYFTEVRKFESFLFPALFLACAYFLQFHVNFVLDRAVPAAHLAIVEGSKDAACWIEVSHLNRGHCIISAVGNCVHHSHKCIELGRV